jgi:hypothetical protein
MTGRDLTLFRRRDPAGTVLRMDFAAAGEADPWTREAQAFVVLLLTDLGSVPSDPGRGTTFLRDLKAGRIYSDALLKAGFDFAVQDILAYLGRRGYAAAGPDRLASVELRRWAVSPGRVELWVEMVSAEGEVIRYDLPVRL